jgi:2'-5' RNA ligase
MLDYTMALAVVSYPSFSKNDLDWIQSVRRKHDKLYYDIINPHITIVFPTENVSKQNFIEHIREQTLSISPFEIVFRCAIIGDPNFQNHAHIFLIPDEGFSDIVLLHDRLYTGLLIDELRLDILFIPHMGIANKPTPEDCKPLIEKLNAEKFDIRGLVDTLDVINFDGESVWTIEKIDFGDENKKEA